MSITVERNMAYTLRQSGMSYSQIAQAMGLKHKSNVQYLLRDSYKPAKALYQVKVLLVKGEDVKVISSTKSESKEAVLNTLPVISEQLIKEES